MHFSSAHVYFQCYAVRGVYLNWYLTTLTQRFFMHGYHRQNKTCLIKKTLEGISKLVS